MLKVFFSLSAALVIVAAIVGGIVFGARSVTIPVTQEHYEICLDNAQKQHTPEIDCPKTETLWDRGFEDPVAYYTFWLALFTVALAVGAMVQSVLIGRQIGLARDEFIATHRPILKVRAMEQFAPVEGKRYCGSIVISNVGVSPAKVVEIRTDTGRRQPDTQWKTKGAWFSPKPELKAIELPVDCTIPSGVPKSFLVRGQSPLDGVAMASAEMDRQYPRLRLIGEVAYLDGAGNRRRTGFQFHWNAMGGQWQKPETPEPEFEYED